MVSNQRRPNKSGLAGFDMKGSGQKNSIEAFNLTNCKNSGELSEQKLLASNVNDSYFIWWTIHFSRRIFLPFPDDFWILAGFAWLESIWSIHFSHVFVPHKHTRTNIRASRDDIRLLGTLELYVRSISIFPIFIAYLRLVCNMWRTSSCFRRHIRTCKLSKRCRHVWKHSYKI